MMDMIVKAEEKHVTTVGKLWWELMMFHQNVDKNQVAYSFWNKQGFKV
jgi:uncharacterized ferritin-like protein (DUF455 family)